MGSRSTAKGAASDTASLLLNWLTARKPLTQQAVAKQCGYTPSAISKMIKHELDPTGPKPPPPRFRRDLLREFPGPDTERLCARWARQERAP